MKDFVKRVFQMDDVARKAADQPKLGMCKFPIRVICAKSIITTFGMSKVIVGSSVSLPHFNVYV